MKTKGRLLSEPTLRLSEKIAAIRPDIRYYVVVEVEDPIGVGPIAHAVEVEVCSKEQVDIHDSI